jgi:hypothetical protein
MMILQLGKFHTTLVLILILLACGQAMKIDVQEIKNETAGLCLSVAKREKVLYELRRNIAALLLTSEVNSGITTTTLHTESPIATTDHDQISTTKATTTLSPPPAIYSCKGTTGWRRIAFINMTDTSSSTVVLVDWS